MNCPLDNTPLAITERQGIEIDYCPKCRGVWLDRGELDKLIERGTTYNVGRGWRDDDDDETRHTAPSSSQGQRSSSGSDIAGVVGDLLKGGLDKRRESHGYSHPSKKKKGGLLGELFDF